MVIYSTFLHNLYKLDLLLPNVLFTLHNY